MGKNKKSAFAVMAEALIFGKLKDFAPPTSRIGHRRLSIDEIKELIKEEFGKAKDVSKEKAKTLEKGWGAAKVANEVNWVKALDLKEFFFKGDTKKKDK